MRDVGSRSRCGAPERRGGLAGHDEARVQERHIELLAVEADDRLVAVEQLAQGLKLRRLLVVVAHEELPEGEGAFLKGADADEKDVGAGAARQPRRLGVDEGDARRIDERQPLVARQPGGDVGQVGQEVAQAVRAVQVLGCVRFRVEKEGALAVGQDLAGDEVLDRLAAARLLDGLGAAVDAQAP